MTGDREQRTENRVVVRKRCWLPGSRLRVMFFLILFTSHFSLFTFHLFSQTISLEEVRVLSLANSRSLAKYNMQIQNSLLDEKSQLYSMLPSVSAGYSASINYMSRNWEFVNPVDTFTAGLDFSITQILFQGGKGLIQKAISAIATESVRNEALAEYFSVLDATDNAYYAVLEAAATLEAAESSFQSALASFAIAEIRHTSGMISTGEMLRAMADREERENSRNQAQRNLSLNKTRLRALTGLSLDVELEQINFDAYEEMLQFIARIPDDDAIMLYNRLWNVVTAGNPSLARAALNNQRAERNLSLARRDYAPVVSATIFGTTVNYSTAAGFGTTAGGGVSVRGSIPMDYWVMNNRIERNIISRDSTMLDYISAEINLETELQSAFLNVLSSAGSVLHSRLSLEYTERHFEYVSERYRLLQSSITDFNEAATLLINSRNSYIRSRYGFLQGLSRIRSLGAINDESHLIRLLMGN